MKKETTYSDSFKCACKCVHAVLKYMKSHDGFVAAKDLKELVPTLVSFSKWEMELTDGVNNIRWWAILQFSSVGYVKGGFIKKVKGNWYITPEGEKLVSMTPEKAHDFVVGEYRKWKQENAKEPECEDIGEIEEDASAAEDGNIPDLVLLESQAKGTINAALCRKSPYDFQDMVAALLRAMGYYTPFIAPKGKDGGVDIIAYQDPLGAKAPRLKVQVKHKPETAVPANDVRALRGVLSSEDVGVFVTSGTYSSDAKKEVSGGKFIRLIDGEEFIDMWQTYYDKMSDEDKNMLPLKRIAFLGSNE